ncbi:MAG: energy transducer TonB, partial [Chitinophagaceae bacterium]|nr:energy transducer TonB [Chitinophagaceae bacterium]
HYRRGRLTDSVQYWHENGEPEQLGLLDSTGTGRFEEYFSTGSLLQQGQLLAGYKHGSWTVFDEQGRRTMLVQFAADSLLQVSCFDSTGQPASGPCIYEREASFAGGFGGWRRFLEQNFQYPKEAIRNGIEGAVRFLLTVEPDGSVADIEIVASPHELLTKEVRRLMSRTPKWEPAIRFNKPVKTKASQVVFFRLQ